MRKVTPLLLAALSIFPLSTTVSAATTGTSIAGITIDTKTAMGLLLGILAVAVVLCIVTACNCRKSCKKPVSPGAAAIVYTCTALILLVCLVSGMISRNLLGNMLPQMNDALSDAPASDVQAFAPDAEVQDETLPEETVPPTEDPRLSFAPAMTDLSDPANWEVGWEIIVNDEIVESYTREEEISFGEGEDYFALPGIATFRGNNYRNNATYGTAEVTSKTLTKVWSHGIGVYNKWGGCAWTGQPLVIQWDDDTKSIMNLYDSKKTKDGLVEVIYATLDGNIHFYDLEDGTKTRPDIFMGMNFKGAGAVDPRGYPLMYVGSGIYNGNKAPRMYVVSLIDGSILYEYGNNDPFAGRNWSAFDSSPLVDVETDTLIWPGENGLLYTIKLNTEYDKAAGTISVNPDTPVKTRYSTAVSEKRYLGYESSASIVDKYMYVSENGGMFYCVDLNTMDLVWAQDTKDDSNSSPVFEWGEDGNGYIYTAPSLHWTATKGAGSITIYKLDAQTGEIVWEYTRECVTVTDVSGGVQSTPLLGKEGTDLEGLIVYVIARTPTSYDGVMIAFDKETGEVVWEMDTKNYAWSSPTAFYTDDGRAYITITNASGKIRLVDGATGEVLYALGLEQTTEASPVIFGNMMVLGTREGIYGIKIS